MKSLLGPIPFIALLAVGLLAMSVAASAKTRVLVLTDIENEPDDAMSMVRFLVYANQFDVEGLVATTSIHQQKKTAAWRIREIVDAYAQVRDNLELHEKGFPTADALRAVIVEGRPEYGMAAVGKEHDSAGSELLIGAVDRADDHPLWVPVWGGPNVLAQALWKVRETRSKAQLAKFVAKLRVYTISDQDDSGPWIRKNFPDLFYIASPGFHGGGAYHFATWSGISGDKFHGRFAGADFAIVDNPWLDEHIRKKGPLGAQYPQVKFMMEGDTPSFLGLIDNGLNSPEHPDWGGWGGRYELYTPRMRKWFKDPETRPLWTDAEDEVLGNDGSWHTSNKATIWRWRQAFQNDFAARMDWTVEPYSRANHPPEVKSASANPVQAKPGDRISLRVDASDTDGNTLAYQWFYYAEAGSFATQSGRSGAPIDIQGADTRDASFTVPKNGFRQGSLHVIVAVTDDGTPALTRYRRAIINVSGPTRE
jgi:hypothetical protein